MDTEKIYQEDVYCREFEARIIDISPEADGSGRWEVVLNRTAFYPESGGQPWDKGELNGCPVVAVREKDGRIIHVLEKQPGESSVRGRIDWQRRFDHMQQHSGEHILSGIFLSRLNANNVGFHLGAASSQIDLDVDSLDEGAAAEVERLANAAVFANRRVACHLVTPADLTRFRLRKELTKTVSQVRIVEIDGVDCCPCGGTHVALTGEVGLIKILGWEKKKGGVRVDFVCGVRALTDYQEKHRSVAALGVLLSAPSPQVEEAVQKQLEKTEAMKRELALLRRQANCRLAEDLLRDRDVSQPIPVVTHILTDPSGGELTELAGLLMKNMPVAALLAGVYPEAGKTTLLFTASEGLPVNMSHVLKKVVPLIGGKGGGTALTAQGGGANPEKVAELLEWARRLVGDGNKE